MMSKLSKYVPSIRIQFTLALPLVLALIVGCSENELVLPEMTISEVWTSGITFNLSERSEIQLQLSETEAFGALTLDTVVSSTEIVVAKLKSDLTYYYRYRLDEGDDQGEYSAVESFKTIVLPTPSNLRVEKISGDELQVSWSEIRGVVFDFEVATDNQFEQPVSFKSIRVASNARIIESLTPDTEYHIRIRSRNGNSISDWVAFEKVQTTSNLKFTLRSRDFVDNGRMPNQFACNNLSPELNWKNVPPETESLAIVMEDLDFQNGFNHWIIFNISPNLTQLLQGSTGANRPAGSREGTNDTGVQVYFGPCPPNGESHRYVFSLMALDQTLAISGGNIDQFLEAAEPHLIKTAQLTGLYE